METYKKPTRIFHFLPAHKNKAAWLREGGCNIKDMVKLGSLFNFMACCMREKLQRFVVIWFSKAARLNVTDCSTEGLLVLAFASWTAGVISVHKLPEHALLYLEARQQPLLIPDSQHGPDPPLASCFMGWKCWLCAAGQRVPRAPGSSHFPSAPSPLLSMLL